MNPSNDSRKDSGLSASMRGPNFMASLDSTAAASIQRDIEDAPELAVVDEDVDDLAITKIRSSNQDYTLASSYHRPSFIACGQSRAAVIPGLATHQVTETWNLSQPQRDRIREEERSLLRDNDIIPPKHPRRKSFGGQSARGGILSTLRRKASRADPRDDEQYDEGTHGRRVSEGPNERTPLVRADSTLPYGGQDSAENINRKWEEAVADGLIQTTWQREAKVLAKYSRSLIITFLLQYSLPTTSVFTVGHLGTIELGAVSLASMTASITGKSFHHSYACTYLTKDRLCDISGTRNKS